MERLMRVPYRLFRKKSGIYFLEDHRNKKQESLRTRDKTAAKRILAARNEASHNPAINLQIARSYLMVWAQLNYETSFGLNWLTHFGFGYAGR